MNHEIIITSCGRWHLLEKCITSLFDLIGKDHKITLIEDSANQSVREKIENKFGKDLNFIYNEVNIGQIRSIDKAYAQIEAPFIVKIEDDYVFKGNKNFIQDGIDVLNEREDVHFVWLRHFKNYQISHGPNYMKDLFEPSVHTTKTRVPYKMLTPLHCGDWSGFTFMPSVSRTSDYKRMFPEGYIECAKDKIGVFGEHACNTRARTQYNLRSAQLINGCCETAHIETLYK